MTSAQYLSPSEASERLGISQKALRLYEQRGLVTPVRTTAGWRTYGPVEMTRVAEIAALRALGLSLAQVARVLKGEPQDLEPVLAAHQARLQIEARRVTETIERVRTLRTELADGRLPGTESLMRLAQPARDPVVTFDLPWPWGGERFELRDIKRLNYIIGPLGSGKTRLAREIALHLPGAVFLGLDRSDDDASDLHRRLAADVGLKTRVDLALAWLADEGAAPSPDLAVLLAALETDAHDVLVIDMIEQGLDRATQEALIAYLRYRAPAQRPLFMLTRSSAILDLALVGPDETILFCPANHSPPTKVAPYPGAPGYEAVATCLAPPEVRARTEGVIAWRPAAMREAPR
ncbi:MerR family transcriptional regulator [Neorhizobium alkalisoli]|uniref:MerR family transcriptional regulator n=1 Tax=Neorhizobium alkalisoli TaxID=528178 RepID=UPI001FE1BB0B|nr:MerR family transcriptional regulator [Neorhizobium alkalisoli]